jgi:Transcription factor WhiB
MSRDGQDVAHRRPGAGPPRRPPEDHAKIFCSKCPTQSKCRDFATRHHQSFGVRAGTTKAVCARGLVTLSLNSSRVLDSIIALLVSDP